VTSDNWDAKTALEYFNENGFVGPIKIYEPQEAKEILARIRLKNQDRSHILFDNDVNYDRHFDIPELAQHIANPRIVEMLNLFLGPDVLSWRTEFFPKFPGSTGTEWHQVGTYQYATGTPFLDPTRQVGSQPIDVTVWTAFTEATKENGCMKFLPGSHKHQYYDESKAPKRGREGDYASVVADSSFYGYDFEDFKVDPKWAPDESQARAMEMNPGECVIFTAKCVHASYPNTSKRSTRFAISSRYVATHVKVYSGMSGFNAHGGTFDLSNYGCVLVSGKDEFGHNRIRTHDNWGTPFEHREALVATP
jgi:non-haem Fe2+, alpha-ketoglutarate-dependent halogenase